MATLTQADRDKLPASAFCGPNRTYYVTDAQDVESAALLIGKADQGDRAAIRACVIGKAKSNGWPIPNAWKDSAEHSAGAACPSGVQAAAFAVSAPVRREDGYVIRRGKLFEAGDFPDKGFSLSPEEMWLAVDAFKVAPVDLEHTPTVLQGKLGTLERIEQSPNGAELFGEVRLPEWLDNLLSDDERKVSCTWSRDTKQLTGLALVRSPRITDATLFAAFAGQRHSDKDAADMQQIHDLARGQGAECDSTEGNPMTTAEVQPNTDVNEQIGMFGRFMRWMGSQEGSQVSAPATFSAPAAPQTPAAPTITPPDPEKELLKQQIAQLRAQQIADRAAAFAAEQITASKALPAQRDALIAAYSVAAADDAEHGQATFATGRGSRVDALASIFSTAPAHTLTTELVPVDPSKMRQLPNPAQLTGTSNAKFSDETIDHEQIIRMFNNDPKARTVLRDIGEKALLSRAASK